MLAMVAAVVLVLLVILFAFRSQVMDLVRRETKDMHRQEQQMLEVTAAISQEIQLHPLLLRIMDTVTDILEAERSTLFLYDAATDELWSSVAQGIDGGELRFSARKGIAGDVFSDGKAVNIVDAYADDRFNKEMDGRTGFRTSSMLAMRVQSKTGVPMGVIQVLNKHSGVFTRRDEQRLRGFTAQAAIAIENARLFQEISRIKNYNEAILASMSTAVVTFDADGNIVKANEAALRLFDHVNEPDRLVGNSATRYFTGANVWMADAASQCLTNGEPWQAVDVSLHLERVGPDPAIRRREAVSVNLDLLPLTAADGSRLGLLLMIEDITVAKRLKTAVARYMPKEVADRLVEGGEAALQGTSGEATIVFADIWDFTSFSERCGPQETVNVLNGYFSVMSNIVMANGGILDKYIGDAILAVFGAPFAQPRDADNALACAIAMAAALRRFNQRRAADGKETLAIGIGVSSGEVISGNIGGENSKNYTVLGEGVKLASRLETATRAYHARVLLSEFSRAALQGDFRLREVDLLRVKGKAEPVAIYEAMAAYDDAEFARLPEVLQRWPEAMAAYRARRWAEAQAGFEACSALNPKDGLAQLYINRCAFFAQRPPAPDWDGVWHSQQPG